MHSSFQVRKDLLAPILRQLLRCSPRAPVGARRSLESLLRRICKEFSSVNVVRRSRKSSIWKRICGYTSRRSSIPVLIAPIGLKTRTKQRGTRILFIYVDTAGRAPLLLAWKQHFTALELVAGTTFAAIVERSSRTRLSGICAPSTSTTCTNLANATKRRNSSGLITSGNT